MRTRKPAREKKPRKEPHKARLEFRLSADLFKRLLACVKASATGESLSQVARSAVAAEVERREKARG